MGGEWNVIRFPSEKSSGGTITPDMRCFLDWVNAHSLIDLQLSGDSYVWSNHRSLPTMSWLDRFPVSTELMDLYPAASQLALLKLATNHCLILLDSKTQ